MTDSLSQPDFHWREIWLGFGISLAFTLAAGLPLTLTSGSIWWLAWCGVGGLFGGAMVAARRARTREPLNGAMIALFYFVVVAAVYLVGLALEVLPDPLPGLATDNSTFFFVWPLAQIVAGTVGALAGGVHWRR